MPYRIAIALQGLQFQKLKVSGTPMAINPLTCAPKSPADKATLGANLTEETRGQPFSEVAMPLVCHTPTLKNLADVTGYGQIAGLLKTTSWTPRVAPFLVLEAAPDLLNSYTEVKKYGLINLEAAPKKDSNESRAASYAEAYNLPGPPRGTPAYTTMTAV